MGEFPKRIVYVDDEPQARRIAKQVLDTESDDGFFVTCATGLELIARLNVLQPDLILLDLRMPDMNGPDTIEAMRKLPAPHHAPIIFVTERKKVVMLDEYKALGVIGIIYKPFDAKNLKPQIQQYWTAYRAEMPAD